MVARKHPARTSKSCLDFIDDQQDSILFANFLDPVDVIFRGNNESSFAGHKLENNAGYVFRRHVRTKKFFQGIKSIHGAVFIGIGKAIYFRGERTESEFVRFDFAGHAHGQKGAPMKSMFKNNHSGTSCAMAGDFYRVFHSFRAAVSKQSFFRKLARCDCIQLFSESNVAFVHRDAKAAVRQLL